MNFLAVLFEGFFGTAFGTIFGTVFGTVLNCTPGPSRPDGSPRSGGGTPLAWRRTLPRTWPALGGARFNRKHFGLIDSLRANVLYLIQYNRNTDTYRVDDGPRGNLPYNQIFSLCYPITSLQTTSRGLICQRKNLSYFQIFVFVVISNKRLH